MVTRSSSSMLVCEDTARGRLPGIAKGGGVAWGIGVCVDLFTSRSSRSRLGNCE